MMLAEAHTHTTGPVLLGIPPIDGKTGPDPDETASWKTLPRHKDEDQVQLDVNRSFIYYPDGTRHPRYPPFPKTAPPI